MKLPEQNIEALMCPHESRYTLQGVYFDAARELLVATDGRAIAVIPAVAEKNDQSGLISGIAWKMGRAAARRIPRKLREGAQKVSASFQVLKSRLIVRGHGETTVLAKVTGQFPDWQQLFDGFKPQYSVSFDVGILKNLSAALCEPGKPLILTLFVQDATKPIGVLAHYGTGVGLLMPGRTDSASFTKRYEEIKGVQETAEVVRERNQKAVTK